jgi:hypothetical protein
MKHVCLEIILRVCALPTLSLTIYMNYYTVLAQCFFCRNTVTDNVPCKILVFALQMHKLQEKPEKENIQHFKIWKFFTFFYICGSFSPPGSGSGSTFKIRIRIQKLELMRIHVTLVRTHGMTERKVASAFELIFHQVAKIILYPVLKNK